MLARIDYTLNTQLLRTILLCYYRPSHCLITVVLLPNHVHIRSCHTAIRPIG
jgi:hypothetical protein